MMIRIIYYNLPINNNEMSIKTRLQLHILIAKTSIILETELNKIDVVLCP